MATLGIVISIIAIGQGTNDFPLPRDRITNLRNDGMHLVWPIKFIYPYLIVERLSNYERITERQK